MSKSSDTQRVLRTALRYYKDLKLSVIPVRPDNKKPYAKWLEYQKKLPSQEQIRDWFTKNPDAMIGIVTGKLSGVVVIDCDHEQGYQEVQKYLPDSFESWIAKSPRGWHIYFRYPSSLEVSNKASMLDGVDVRGEGGYIIASPSINAEGKPYSWIISPDESSLGEMPKELYNIYINNSLYRGGVGNVGYYNNDKGDNDDNDDKNYKKGRRDNDLFHLANCLTKGNCELAFIRQTLEIIARNIEPPFPESEVNLKIESAIKRAKRREVNITADIRDWVLATKGDFLTTDVYKELQLTTKETMKSANRALLRLCEGSEPLLEKHGMRRGAYRRIENQAEIVDFMNAPTEEFPVLWPLEIEALCKIYPGNIIIVAGSKSSGKTGFLLNVAKLNMNQHEVVYLNSEMGDTEFRTRLELFDDLKLTDWKLKAYHRASGFADLVTPERKIFIVDFLEVTTDFWKVAQYIQEIHKKLKDGICVIGLQKSDNKETGRGGDFSKEKARLYIGLDYIREEKTNVAKIVDAKAWRSDKNPRGMTREYKLIQGSKFWAAQGWRD